MPNQYKNKVVYGNTTIIDITDTTAVASDVATGKYFYLATGQRVQGSSTSGLEGPVTQDAQGFLVLSNQATPIDSEIETGIYTPSTDIAQPTINFAKTHNDRPFFVMISDASTEVASQNSNYWWALISFYDALGTFPGSYYYARTQYLYQSASSSATGGYNISRLSGTTSSSIEYWLTSSEFNPSTGGTSRYWRSGRSYKWIAVWKLTS